MQPDICVQSANLFEIRVSSAIYTFVHIQPNYLQTIFTNTQTNQCYLVIYAFNDFDGQIRSEFKNCLEVFEAIKMTKSLRLEFKKEDSNQLKINFDVGSKQQYLTFHLKQRSTKDSNEQIQDYKNRIQVFCQENRELTNNNHQRDERVRQLEIDLRLIKKNYQILQKELKSLQNEFKERGYHQRQQDINMTHLPFKASYNVTVNSVDYDKQIAEKENNKDKFVFVPMQNQNFAKLGNFFIEGQKIKVVKGYKDSYQVVSQNPILNKENVLISIKVIHSRHSNIYFGLIKESRRKQKFTRQHQEAISYKLRGGRFLFQDGVQSGEEIPWIKDGETLNLSIDNENKELTWFIEDKFMMKRRIPKSMQNYDLYPFVSLQDEGDEVQIM